VCNELIMTAQLQAFAPSDKGVSVVVCGSENGPHWPMDGGWSENCAISCSVVPRGRVRHC
jgi:hypothetical protein